MAYVISAHFLVEEDYHYEKQKDRSRHNDGNNDYGYSYERICSFF